METKNTPEIRFPETSKGKSLLVIATFVAGLTLTALITGNWRDPTTILFFPVGLVMILVDQLVNIIYGPNVGGGSGETIAALSIPFGWLLYLVMALSIVSIKDHRFSRSLFIVFAILLIVNIAGCSIVR